MSEENTNNKPNQPTESQRPLEALSVVRVRIVDAREPFPVLAQLGLGAVPNIGDLLRIQASTGLANYRVEFRNFNPFDEFQVTLGCLPFNVPALTTGGSAPNRDRMEEVIKYNLQIFDKALAYTNAIILAGYAGLFTLWSFTQKNLSPRQIDTIAFTLGFSLLLFVSWQIYTMVQNASSFNRFNEIIDETPDKFFERFAVYQSQQRLLAKTNRRIWAWSFYPTLLLGYAAGFLLMYNVLAHLLGWPQWP